MILPLCYQVHMNLDIEEIRLCLDSRDRSDKILTLPYSHNDRRKVIRHQAINNYVFYYQPNF
jgi:hypothetical protein